MAWMLASAAGAVFGGSVQVFGNTVGQTASGMARGGNPISGVIDPMGLIENRIRANSNDPTALTAVAVAEMRALLTSTPQTASAQRDRAAQALTRAQNITPEQAQAQITQLEQQYRQSIGQVQEMASQAAGAAREGIAWSAILTALALILGGVAGWFGGRAGVVEFPFKWLQTDALSARRN
jgi:carbohydrate-binding DOMON domain-containing protein